MKENLFFKISIVIFVSLLVLTCQDEIESYNPKQKPKAAFIVLVDSVHNTKTIQLFNVSQNETHISWDFGDGNISNLDVNEYTFSNPGTYIITLKVSDGNFTDSFSDTISIIQSSNHNRTFADNKGYIIDTCGCEPFESSFEFTNDGTWLNINWNFGDPSSSSNFSSEYNTSHKYMEAGIYSVNLEIQNSDTSINYNTNMFVSIKPDASFACRETASILYPDIIFYNSSSNNSTSYWSFGDGFVSKELNPTHKYASVGDFTVKLFVQNKFGCFDSTSRIINIYAEND
jgi:PKD repeat protein